VSPLETTLIQQAGSLAALRNVVAIPLDERGHILEFTAAEARMAAIWSSGTCRRAA
jgi:hypothetical protein